MELTELASGVFELRLPIPWEDGRVNCFLFPGGRRVDLIDCGMNGQDSLSLIRAAVREVAGPKARLGHLVVTHIHPDHYGGAGELTERDGALLFLHRLEVPMVHPRYLEIEQLVAEVGQHLHVHGVPTAEVAELKNASRGIRQYVGVAAPTVQLDGSETIELGSRSLRVEWTPGHSPGHICLFDRESGLLFAGDQLLPETSPNIGLHPQSTPDPLDDYLTGLRRLAALRPRLVLPAHGRPFDSVSHRASQLTAHHARRKEQIIALIGEEELSGWEVTIRVWGRREDLVDRRMALQEGLAHLQSLSREGRLEKRAAPGRVTWRRLPSNS